MAISSADSSRTSSAAADSSATSSATDSSRLIRELPVFESRRVISLTFLFSSGGENCARSEDTGSFPASMRCSASVSSSASTAAGDLGDMPCVSGESPSSRSNARSCSIGSFPESWRCKASVAPSASTAAGDRGDGGNEKPRSSTISTSSSSSSPSLKAPAHGAAAAGCSGGGGGGGDPRGRPLAEIGLVAAGLICAVSGRVCTAVLNSSASMLMDASPSVSSPTLMEKSTSCLGALFGRAAGECKGEAGVDDMSIDIESPMESSSRMMLSEMLSWLNVITSAPPPLLPSLS